MQLCWRVILLYLQCYHVISIAPTHLSPTPHISNFSPPLLQTPPPTFCTQWQILCFDSSPAVLSWLHTHTYTHTQTSWPWPSESPVHIHNVLRGCRDTRGALRGWRVCVSLFAVCDYACCHRAAVCMFNPAVHLYMDGAVSGAAVIWSHHSWAHLHLSKNAQKNEPILDACCAGHIRKEGCEIIQ